MPTSRTALTVAVTGPTGTFGHGLVPLLQDDPRIRSVVGVARRPFDPAAEGWTKLAYRQGDVRDREGLAEAFAGADVVVHLAFAVFAGNKQATREVNLEGTLNAFRAAAEAGVRRFVYASSVAAYGFHPDNPYGMREDWPVRPAHRLFYSQEKAELEQLLATESAALPGTELYLLRPCVVLGPHTVGSKRILPGPLAPLNRYLQHGMRRLPVPLPAVVPEVPLQLVHEEDVGRALLQAVVAAGPPGAYNIAGDGVLTLVDVARELGLLPVPVPARPVQRALRAAMRVPRLPETLSWLEAFSEPVIMDTTRAKDLLGWRPRYTGLEALRATLDR